MNRQPGNDLRGICRIDAWAVADAGGVVASPASLLADIGADIEVLAVDRPEAADRHPAAAHAHVVSRPRDVVIPGLVNAHTHLDLTHIGPQLHDPDDGFVSWVDRVRDARHTDDASIASSVRRGIDLSLAGGTVAVGDIAGGLSLAPLRECRGAGLAGVSFLEYFAIGTREQAGTERLARFVKEHRAEIDRPHAMQFGLQPHAPNTVSLAGYQAGVDLAQAHGWPLATHLAETLEERAFIEDGTGPQRALLERFGIWEARILEDIGMGKSPVRHLQDVLHAAGWLVAHVNDLDDEGLGILADAGVGVVYCPRASAYFGAADRLGPHRYQDMMKAGIPVALGTDSIVNLPERAVESNGMSVLDEMRHLCRRDGLAPSAALGMGTTTGMAVLGCDPRACDLRRGARPAGLVGVEVEPAGDPLAALMAGDHPPDLIARSISVE